MLVLQSFFARGRFYAAGSTVDVGDPIIKGREALFVAVDGPRASVPVEQATAAPGEVRNVAKKSTARKPAPAKRTAKK